ncbi:uncharacterized protein LOC117120197 isoform X1 [Anneissia japonica]|uniref:uncharacterized protein LOC117120197 isoform X1 n=2 Tax=Anneissia japonica TaxID=1529436 RepID=UPI0014259140|nr:uncharacterized protein LOC117120197 isoform X1 [Anneissia japonica]
MVDGLAFLPPDKVTEGMQLLKDNIPEVLTDFVDYFDVTYVSGTYTHHAAQNDQQIFRRMPPTFGIDIWNVHQLTLNGGARTNNLCESWNRKHLENVGHTNPSIWKAIDGIKRDEAASATLIELFRRGQPVPVRRITKVTVNHQQRLVNIISKYNDRTKTLEETITALGYNIRMK